MASTTNSASGLLKRVTPSTKVTKQQSLKNILPKDRRINDMKKKNGR